eukprot:2580703-Ditylum_brightwellii.AAC.1
MDTCNTHSPMITVMSLAKVPVCNGNLPTTLSQYMLQLLMVPTYGCVDHFILLFQRSKVWQSESVTFIMASDGSSDEEKNVMTFGWKIVDKAEDPLAEHSGPAFGKATSFCAE